MILPAFGVPWHTPLWGGVMDEWISKAIPLRRARGRGRVTTSHGAGIRARVVRGVSAVLAPPRELWLASLGTASLAVRLVRVAWSHVVAEGMQAESALRRALGRGPTAGAAA